MTEIDERALAIAALQDGVTLVMSNGTNIPSRTIHSHLGKRLVFDGVAEYLPDPDREGCKLETHIRKRDDDG